MNTLFLYKKNRRHLLRPAAVKIGHEKRVQIGALSSKPIFSG